jgi:sugar lactone lactonase YvrE
VDGNDHTVPGKDGKPTVVKVGCDGITMDVRAEWVYFALLTGRSVYRIRVPDLNDEKLLSTELSAKVERYSDKPNNGGLSIDYAGNLYLTAVESKSIGVVGRSQVRTFLTEPEMVRPDGITAGPDGYMYVSASQISAAAMFHGGKAESKVPT